MLIVWLHALARALHLSLPPPVTINGKHALQTTVDLWCSNEMAARNMSAVTTTFYSAAAFNQSMLTADCSMSIILSDRS